MDAKIKYLIVEDEEKSRSLLLGKIQMCNISQITCIGMAANAAEALILAKLTRPDFILLDINLPGKSGFDLIRDLELEGITPQVIFTSAHTEADILLNALKYSPITYLVKPIDLDELEEAILKVCGRIQTGEKEKTGNNKLTFQGNMGPVYILPEHLILVKADAHYSRLFLENGKEMHVNHSISEIEKVGLLSSKTLFIRPDRSTILNLSKIISIHTKTNECILARGHETVKVKVSENGLKMLKKAMSAF